MRIERIQAYVLGTGAAAVSSVAAVWPARGEFPGAWGIGVLVLVAFLLQIAATDSRGGNAEGSLSFVTHLAAAVLFGVVWGAVTAGLSTLLSQVLLRRPLLKVAFNVSQRTIAVVGALLVFKSLGGKTPPVVLLPGAEVGASALVSTILAFLASAATYFALNSVLVSVAVALTTERRFRDIWSTAFMWVVGYDIGASLIALFVAWLYLQFDGPDVMERLGFLLFVVPLILAKHVYAKLNTLQVLYDELDRAHERLELALREQLETMVRSIEARDPYTSGHSRRVAALSRSIAAELGLPEVQVDEIENAALLHDVGKIHAEFAPLLQKEGRLTQEEWEVMKTHAAKSAELVALFTRFKGHVEESVRWHHERWDGRGYPDGIVGEKIPLGARIVMISDTIDAMTTDRPYRKALSFERVIAELQKYSGSQFDPRLVEVAVSSVTIRRLVSEGGVIAGEPGVDVGLRRGHRPALRSQSNFLEAIRAAASVGPSG
jgi:hypothetical protein